MKVIAKRKPKTNVTTVNIVQTLIYKNCTTWIQIWINKFRSSR